VARLGRSKTLRRAAGAGLCLLCVGLVACGAGIPAPSKLALVYAASTGATFVADAGGAQARSLGQTTQALLSPSGAVVAALSGGNGHSPALLSTYKTSGPPGRHVVARFALPTWSRSGVQLLAFSPDSNLLALTAVRLSGAGAEQQLLVVNLASGALTTVAAGDIDGASFSPSLPDTITFAAASVSELDNGRIDIYTANADGSHRRRIVAGGLNTNPVWGAEGIVFGRLRKLGSATTSSLYELWLVSPDGGKPRELTTIDAGPLAAGPQPAISVSANGRRLVADFTSPYSSNFVIDVWTIDLSGSQPRTRRLELGSDPILADAISRSGKQVLIDAAAYGTFGPRIETVAFGGGQAHVLAHGALAASWNR
jgi:hypothetical protein